MKDKIIMMLKNVKPGISDNDIEGNLFDNEILDSLGMAFIIPQLEEEFNIEIEVDEIDPDNFETIDMICEFISSKIK